jgi:hypothetical protein
VRLNADGLITELTFFVRPLPGLTALLARIGPEMLKDKRPALARVISAATHPLATMTRLGDSHLIGCGVCGGVLGRGGGASRCRSRR